MRTEEFDVLAYIENAFLDGPMPRGQRVLERDESELPVLELVPEGKRSAAAKLDGPISYTQEASSARRFRKTNMSAPRPRRARKVSGPAIDPELQSVWETLPKTIAFLCSFYDDSVTANYYRGEFKESRKELVRRLLDPELSLEETSRLLGVCPATVRRYTNRGWLTHHRTAGGQRRFRLSNLMKFVDQHGRFPEE